MTRSVSKAFSFTAILVLVGMFFASGPREATAAGPSTGSIAGVCVDTGGVPVAGATVLLAGNGFTTQTISGSNGEFRFNSVPVGVYTVTAAIIRGNTIGSGSATVTVERRKTSNVTVVMTFTPI